MHANEKNLRRFTVELGFSQVTVDVATPLEAVAAARRELARQMPWLWDVIHETADERFRVRTAS